MNSLQLESIVVAALLGCVLLSVAWLLRRRGLRLLVVTLITLCCSAGAWTAMRYRELPKTELDVSDRPIEVLDEGYVSSGTCRSCHPRPHDTWHASYHRTMTQVASPRAILGDFHDVRLSREGRDYDLRRRGDEFFVEMADPQARQPPPDGNRIEKRVVMMTGSHHLQFYWYPSSTDRSLSLFEWVHLREENRWIPFWASLLNAPARDLRPGTELEWSRTCIRCHTTRGRPRITTDGNSPHQVDTHVSEIGIACEACHGPGEAHVQANRSPLRRSELYATGEQDATIVNPANLSAARGSQVCGQCHGIFQTSSHEKFREFLRDGFSYRPGDDLHQQRLVVQRSTWSTPRFQEFISRTPNYIREQFWLDGMVRVTGREYNGLIESPCFQNGEGERQLSCLSCHSMHQATDDKRSTAAWTDDQLLPGMRGNRACLECHEEFADEGKLEAHTHHEPASSGSLCYNCHMPHTTYGLLKAVRSHTVSSPSVSESLELGRPNACSQCHLNRSLGWVGSHLSRWYDVPEVELTTEHEAVPASLFWLLSGDAAQRALAAWTMGWKPARNASGAGWLGGALAQLLMDPYDAVRFIAARSLRRDPEFRDFEYDFLAPENELAQKAQEAGVRWKSKRRAAGKPDSLVHLLHDPDRTLPSNIFRLLYERRDDTPVYLRE